MKSICVYLGAKFGKGNSYKEKTIALGKEIAKQNFRLIYGGSSEGLMGLLARTVLENGGEAIGIMPKCLFEREKPLEGLTDLIVTETMQQRKLLLQEHSDAFIVMPGGLGTFEEAFETWNAIKTGIIDKPIGFLNLDNYFDSLFTFLNRCNEQEFISKEQLNIPIIENEPADLVSALTEVLMPTSTLSY